MCKHRTCALSMKYSICVMWRSKKKKLFIWRRQCLKHLLKMVNFPFMTLNVSLIFANMPMCPQFPLTAILKTAKNSIRSAQLHCCTSCALVCHNTVTDYKKIMVFFYNFAPWLMKVLTQQMLGTTVCSHCVKREISHFSKNSSDLFHDIVKDAIENNYLVTLMIDDWTKMYTKRTTYRWSNIGGRQFLHHYQGCQRHQCHSTNGS